MKPNQQTVKNWYVETKDGRHVVRGTGAGMILSDSLNDPSLYDFNTAKMVADSLTGMLGLTGVIVHLVAKPHTEKPHVAEQ